MLRQPGPFREAAEGFSTDEQELLDWMEETGTQPGGDMSGFFG